MIFTLTYLNQVIDVRKNFESYVVLTAITVILAIFCLNSVMSAVLSRMRLVFHAFDIKSNVDIKSKWSYFKIIPIHVLLFFISIISPILYFFGPAISPSLKPSSASPSALIFYLYVVWLLYYTYKLRDAPTQFSDAITNLRCTLFMVVAFSIVIIWDIVDADYGKDSMFGTLGFQYVIQNSLCELTYVHYIMNQTTHYSKSKSRNGTALKSYTSKKENYRTSTCEENEKTILEKNIMLVNELMLTEADIDVDFGDKNDVYDGTADDEMARMQVVDMEMGSIDV
eukprot:Pgem_evm1s13833